VEAFFLPLFLPPFSVYFRCFPFDAVNSAQQDCCMTADLKGRIFGAAIPVSRLTRLARRPKQNEAFATQVADAYLHMRFEEGLPEKQAVFRIGWADKISRSYVHKLLNEVANRPEY
jgi:hypothetical protein